MDNNDYSGEKSKSRISPYKAVRMSIFTIDEDGQDGLDDSI